MRGGIAKNIGRRGSPERKAYIKRAQQKWVRDQKAQRTLQKNRAIFLNAQRERDARRRQDIENPMPRPPPSWQIFPKVPTHTIKVNN